MKDQVFLIGQKAFISNDKGELLVLMNETIGLDLPGGKIKVGESDIQESLKREVREETRLEIEIKNVFYAWKPEKNPDFDTGLYLIGYTCEIKNGTIALSHEHSGYRWLSKDDFLNLEDKKGHREAIEYYFNNKTDA